MISTEFCRKQRRFVIDNAFISNYCSCLVHLYYPIDEYSMLGFHLNLCNDLNIGDAADSVLVFGRVMLTTKSTSPYELPPANE